MKGIGMKNYMGARCLVSSEQHKKKHWAKKGRCVEPHELGTWIGV